MLKSRTMSPAESSRMLEPMPFRSTRDTGGGVKEVPGKVQVVLVQSKVEQVEQHSHTVSEDGCQTGTEHAHVQLHGKDIVQHDIADIAGGSGDHHQTGVAVRPDDDAQGAGEDIGKGEQVDGAHIVHHFGEDAVSGAEYPGQRHNEHRGEQGQGQAHNCQQYHRLGKDPVGLLGLVPAR